MNSFKPLPCTATSRNNPPTKPVERQTITFIKDDSVSLKLYNCEHCILTKKHPFHPVVYATAIASGITLLKLITPYPRGKRLGYRLVRFYNVRKLVNDNLELRFLLSDERVERKNEIKEEEEKEKEKERGKGALWAIEMIVSDEDVGVELERGEGGLLEEEKDKEGLMGENEGVGAESGNVEPKGKKVCRKVEVGDDDDEVEVEVEDDTQMVDVPE